MASKKRTFTLKNIDTTSINNKYGLVIISNLQKENNKDDINKTKISDVISIEEHSVSFLDENKKENKCSVTMLEYISKKEIPRQTDLKCFWCRHTFETCPIGCPIKYVNPTIEKSYISHITKDKYYMKENITTTKLKNTLSNKKLESQMEIIPFDNSYYLTDGIFCSFNCVLSFIKDNSKDFFYKESYSLLHSMYESIVGKKISKILPAPHWRLLKEYGGNLSIENFRKTFNLVEYEFIFNIRELKDMKSIGKVYREKF